MVPSEDKIIECIMCKLETYENFYSKHIQYHHMVQEDWLIAKIMALGVPRTYTEAETQTVEVVDEAAKAAEQHGAPLPSKPPDPDKATEAGPRRGRPPKKKKIENGNPLPKDRSSSETSRDPVVESAAKPLSPTENQPPLKSVLKLKIKTQNGTMYSEVNEVSSSAAICQPELEKAASKTETEKTASKAEKAASKAEAEKTASKAEAEKAASKAEKVVSKAETEKAVVKADAAPTQSNARQKPDKRLARRVSSASSEMNGQVTSEPPTEVSVTSAANEDDIRPRQASAVRKDPVVQIPTTRRGSRSLDSSSGILSKKERAKDSSSKISKNTDLANITRLSANSVSATGHATDGNDVGAASEEPSTSRQDSNTIGESRRLGGSKSPPRKNSAGGEVRRSTVGGESTSLPADSTTSDQTNGTVADRNIPSDPTLTDKSSDVVSSVDGQPSRSPLVVIRQGGLDLDELEKKSDLRILLKKGDAASRRGRSKVDGASSIMRYRCSGCSFVHADRSAVDEHVSASSCGGPTSLLRTKTQVMRIVLEVVPGIQQHSAQDYVISQLSPSLFAWREADATLPSGWNISDKSTYKGKQKSIFLSPSGQIFSSRSRISEYLLSTGIRIASVNGFKLTGGDGGGQTQFVYRPTDPNRLQKALKHKFFADYEIDKDRKIRDKNPRNPERTVYTQQTITYKHALCRRKRPRILLEAVTTATAESLPIRPCPPQPEQISPPQAEEAAAPAAADAAVAGPANCDSPAPVPAKTASAAEALSSQNNADKSAPTGGSNSLKRKMNEDTRSPLVTKKVKKQCTPSASAAPGLEVKKRSSSGKSGPKESSVSKPTESEPEVPQTNAVPNKDPMEDKPARKVRSDDSDNCLYVQCCNVACKIWRQVKHYRDASQVPKYWVCSMNRDAQARVCGVGGGSQFISPSKVKIKFPQGSLVWAKMKGYPWWPGMIERSPESDDYYWMEEEYSTSEPARYNIIFFEPRMDFSSAWIRTENIQPDKNKMIHSNIVLSQEIKDNLAQAVKILDKARECTVSERLIKFSPLKNGVSNSANNAAAATKKVTETKDGQLSKSSPTPNQVAKPEVKLMARIKPEHLYSKCNPAWEKMYNKPPLPSDVLITLAVRNLDPQNQSGASLSSIVAFLTLHFPYFNRNMEECKEMVRKAYDINSKEETGKENFRIKKSLIQRLSERIMTYINRNRSLVCDAMIFSEFLDTLVERFMNGSEHVAAKDYRPSYSLKMLVKLALISLYPPVSLEQIFLFLTFIFPCLAEPQSAFKREECCKEIETEERVEVTRNEKGERFYHLQEGSYPVVLREVRDFFSTKSNLQRFNKSIYKKEFIQVVLPNLISSHETSVEP